MLGKATKRTNKPTPFWFYKANDEEFQYRKRNTSA